MSKDPNFPAKKWHPETGESRIFAAPEDVPEGYLDHHPNHKHDTKPDPKPKADVLPMSREDIRKELDAASITYPKNAGTKALYELLGDTLKQFCANNKIDYDPNAAVPDLLKLVKKPAE